MILKLSIIAAFITTTMFAQGFGGQYGRRSYNPAAQASGGSVTVRTPAQLAAAELTRIARFLKLDSADTSKLTGSSTLVGFIEAEQTTLQTNAAALKTAYTALATDLATNNTKDSAAQETTIQNTVNSSFTARVTAASQVVTALPGRASQ